MTADCQTLLHPFYSSLDFVRDYPGELVPEPIWILLKQETVSGSGISWAICKSVRQLRKKRMQEAETYMLDNHFCNAALIGHVPHHCNHAVFKWSDQRWSKYDG